MVWWEICQRGASFSAWRANVRQPREVHEMRKRRVMGKQDMQDEAEGRKGEASQADATG